MDTIDREEILKTSKWIRFLFMVLYAFLINFVLPITIGLAFIQFLFVLFTSKTNASISNINSYIIEFFNDCIAFLIFETEQKPFPFKSNHNNEAVIEGDSVEVSKESEEDSNEVSDKVNHESKD